VVEQVTVVAMAVVLLGPVKLLIYQAAVPVVIQAQAGQGMGTAITQQALAAAAPVVIPGP
jgi:hypothetical protein